MNTRFFSKFLAAFRKISYVAGGPSPSTLHVVDSLEWEITMARYHASYSSSIALGFALLYNLVYTPTELSSLQTFQDLYQNLSSAANFGAFAGGIGDEWRDAAMVNNMVNFYYGRVISRFVLLLFISFCIGAFLSCRFCISDAVFRCYFQEYLLKELRGLNCQNANFGTLLVMRLINADMLTSFAANHPDPALRSNELQILGIKFQTLSIMSFVVNLLNPIMFLFAYLPSRILRFLFPKQNLSPQPFLSVRHACFQLILYNNSMRRSAQVPIFFQDFFCLLSSRFVPRRLFLKFCESETRELLKETDAIFNKFPIEQRVHLYSCIICHTSVCLFTLCLLFLLFFLQNALSSEIVVASWFTIPHSQIQAQVNDTTYALFHNYRELVNWEYVINDHFIFLLFFAVNITCNNTTMLLVLAPTFIVMSAGIASNHGKNVNMASIDSWFITSLVFSYILSFITNSLTHRDVCEMFINRATDCAVVSDNTMLELSHEFLSLSHITLEAMDVCCESATEIDSQRIKCLMWLLRKQRLQIQAFRPAFFDGQNRTYRSEAPPSEVSIRKVFREEFQVVDPVKTLKFGHFGVYFASVCASLQCAIEFKYEFEENLDIIVSCVESDIKHFLCSFLLYSVLNAFDWKSTDSAKKIVIKTSFCDVFDLNAMLIRRVDTDQDDSGIRSEDAPHSSRLLKTTHSLHRVHPLLIMQPGQLYVQVVVEVLDTPPSPVDQSGNGAPWIASFYDSDTFAFLEFATRMHGGIQFPRKSESHVDSIVAAFALPCSVSAYSGSDRDESPLALRLLVIEDEPIFLKNLITKIKGLPSSSHYIIHSENNVADALLNFSNAEPHEVEHTDGGNSSLQFNYRAYDVVLIDREMPMERNANPDSDAGIKAAELLRKIEKERKLAKCLMIGITSGGERQQEDFIYDCGQSDMWSCFSREQVWDANWDASVRAKLKTYSPRDTS